VACVQRGLQRNSPALLDSLDENVRWTIIGSTPLSGTYVGRPEVVENLLAPWVLRPRLPLNLLIRALQAFRESGRQDLNLRPPGPQPEERPFCSRRSAICAIESRSTSRKWGASATARRRSSTRSYCARPSGDMLSRDGPDRSRPPVERVPPRGRGTYSPRKGRLASWLSRVASWDESGSRAHMLVR
jgi:hypothetical protein